MKGFGKRHARGKREGSASPMRAASLGSNSAGMERVRLGLVGLSAITLIVFAASAGSNTGPRAPDSAAPGETLSVLGVAPKLENDKSPPSPVAVQAEPVKAGR